MLLGVFFLHRRRKKIVLGIIINHGLGQHLIFLRITGGCTQFPIHKGRNLIHVQINVWHFGNRNRMLLLDIFCKFIYNI